MSDPIYRYQHLKPTFQLRYAWTGWPTRGTRFPPVPEHRFFNQLDAEWQKDSLRRIATNWQPNKIQFTFSTVPCVSPVLFVSRIKGRLQNALRIHQTPIKFSRKVSFRGIGTNHTQEVENYIQSQVEKEHFVDPSFSDMLRKFTIRDTTVALDEPFETNSGRYWYNLHVVLVLASRKRIRSEADFISLDRSIQATAVKHQYQLGIRAWMPDHLHVALRGNINESPADIALSLMNNSAFSMGQNAIWQRGFYVGTFSEYDVRAVLQ